MEVRYAQLRELVDQALSDATLPWWEWNIPANRVTFNRLKVTMLGYPIEDFKGCGYEAFTNLLHPEDYERTMQAMREHLEGRAPIYEIDYRIRRADGGYTWYMDRGCTLQRDEAGRPTLLRGIVLDLGPEFEAAAAREQLVAAARQSLPSGSSTAIVPLCSVCLRMRAGKEGWIELKDGAIQKLQASISHGICPDCIRTMYPDDADEILGEPLSA
jgi:PAS domain S-box-containing protein